MKLSGYWNWSPNRPMCRCIVESNYVKDDIERYIKEKGISEFGTDSIEWLGEYNFLLAEKRILSVKNIN